MAGEKITTQQRRFIRDMLRAVNFDAVTITLMHSRGLNLAESWLGRPVDYWLDSLSKKEASAAIVDLQGIKARR